MNAKQAGTGPLPGNRDRVPGGFQVCDHSSESGDSQAGSEVF